jgi:23S rRNA (uracil1939-C5)-methyltransferase
LNQTLKIEQLVYGGSGLARMDDGKVVLIPFVLPEEIIEIGEISTKGNHFVAEVTKVIQASSERIVPPCPYFGVCGGCQYQHIAYSHQIELKREILKEQLCRLGGLKEIYVDEMTPSEQQFSFRNHVQFHLDADGKPGFQKALSHEVIPVDKCLLVEEPINTLLSTLVFDSEAGLDRVAIRDDGIGVPLVYLSGRSPNPPEFEVDFPLNVIYRSQVGNLVLSGDTYNTFEVCGKPFQVSAGSFFQTNRGITEKMVDHILTNLDFSGNPFILDLFCGVGFFSAFVADKASKLVGIESSEDACSDFAINLDAFDNIELYQGNVEQILPALDIHPDIAIIDPPRAGLVPAAMKALIKCNPTQIAYVSCDPSTLARDLKLLVAAGYKIKSVVPFDMFPQTYHIETIVIMTNSGSKGK